MQHKHSLTDWLAAAATTLTSLHPQLCSRPASTRSTLCPWFLRPLRTHVSCGGGHQCNIHHNFVSSKRFGMMRMAGCANGSVLRVPVLVMC